MEIGVIIHSVTGNTRQVAERLVKSLVEKGHTVDFKEIKTVGDAPDGDGNIKFIEAPSFGNSEVLVFGSHTEAFRLEPAGRLYLGEDRNMEGKKVVCFATHQFPFKWLGGNRTVRTMCKMCLDRGAAAATGVSVEWLPGKDRESRIESAVEEIVSMIGG